MKATRDRLGTTSEMVSISFQYAVVFLASRRSATKNVTLVAKQPANNQGENRCVHHCESTISPASASQRTGTIGVIKRVPWSRSEEHTSELQSQSNLVCRLLLE